VQALALVLRDDLPGQSSVGGKVEALCLSPRADLAAALTARRRSNGRASASCAVHSGAFDEPRQFPAEVSRVLGAEVDLIGPPIDAEGDRLVCGTAGEIVLELHIEALHYYPLGCELLAGRGPAMSRRRPSSFPYCRSSNALTSVISTAEQAARRKMMPRL
jgi:hypothetical protein